MGGKAAGLTALRVKTRKTTAKSVLSVLAMIVIPGSAAVAGTCPSGGSGGKECVAIYKGQGEGSADGGSLIVGGELSTEVTGGYAADSSASDNHVVIQNGQGSRVITGGFGAGSGAIGSNSVTIEDSQIDGYISGGFGAGPTENNRVTVEASQISGFINGGFSFLGGHSSGNSVVLRDSSVDGYVSGGSVRNGDGNATNNSVEISGGRIGDYVSGGQVYSGRATDNHVTISHAPSFAAETILYGGLCNHGSACSDVRSGNRLALASVAAVKGAQNFQHFDFILDETLKGQALLQTTEAVVLTPAGTDNASVDLSVSGTGPLDAGDKFTLIDRISATGEEDHFDINQQAFAAGSNDEIHNVEQKGLVTRTYDFKLKVQEDHALEAEVIGVSGESVSPEAEELSADPAVSVGIANKAADFVAGDGMREALLAAGLDSSFNGGLESGVGAGDEESWHGGIFTAITGGQLRYRANGQTKVNGLSLLGGLSVGIPLPTGQIMLGVFAESGWGNYKGHSKQQISSNGTTRYFGGGLLGRYELGGVYIEASGRAGRTENKYASTWTDGAGNGVNYGRTNTYYGLHGGLGYVMPITEKMSVDVSTKYFWMHQTGNNVSILDTPVKVGAADSHRWRNGVRVNVAVAEGVVPYVGGYYEYEFDAKAKMTTVGLDIPGPSLKGGTGMAELGVTLGAPADAYRVDVGVTGYAGKYSGVIGSVKARWTF